MSLFDDSENIMFIGSDSAEIWIGKDQTAWVLVDGSIHISSDSKEIFKAPF
jgi:hypothetical protein